MNNGLIRRRDKSAAERAMCRINKDIIRDRLIRFLTLYGSNILSASSYYEIKGIRNGTPAWDKRVHEFIDELVSLVEELTFK